MRLVIFTLLAIGLASCSESQRGKIKAETDHLTFLVYNDASRQEQCASMRKLRNLFAEAKDTKNYQFWSQRVTEDC